MKLSPYPNFSESETVGPSRNIVNRINGFCLFFIFVKIKISISLSGFVNYTFEFTHASLMFKYYRVPIKSDAKRPSLKFSFKDSPV